MGKRNQRQMPVETVTADPDKGLTAEQAARRLHCGWSNQTSGEILRTDGQIILQHCATFFNLVFVIMAALLILAGSTVIKLSFLVVVIINTIIGCVQEIRAKRAVEKLTFVTARTLRVIRDGAVQMLRSDLLVRDDIVEFRGGDQICADGILRTGKLLVNEALVTGEEDAIEKAPGDGLLSGSFVVAGTGRAQLTQVGDGAFAAQLAAEAKKDPKAAKSEMMRALDKLIKIIGVLLIPVGALLFCHEYFALDRGLRIGAESTTAALVGMIPEGLYLLTSIALAAATLKLAKQRVLVQDMNCIEALARTDVLCVDKTGTITEAALDVEDVIPLSQDPTQILTAIYGSREPENDTAKAIFEKYQGTTDWKCISYTPFTPETKWSACVFETQGTYLVGAPSCIMGDRYDSLQAQVDNYAQKGLRVLLVARYDAKIQDTLETTAVTPVALVLLSSRIRKQARETFSYFQKQGIAVKVISGDDPHTVSAIAQRAGIANSDAWVDATLLKTEADIAAAVQKYAVFGRVTPQQKRSIVRALKTAGHTVAMTGDGVNDVLAMKEAHCAVAMAGGAQAAGQVAHLTLLDSDFSAMPKIVSEGRRVINNIQRAASLFLVKNIFSLGITLLTLLFGLPYPMEPQHMTVISGLTIGFPAFILAMEPNFHPATGRFLPRVMRRAAPCALTNIALVLSVQIVLLWLQVPHREVSTICTGILAMNGLFMLRQVCRPFARFRNLLWVCIILGFAGCFTLLQGVFEFQFSKTVLWAFLMLPGVCFVAFRVVQRAFASVYYRIGRWLRKKKNAI